MTFHSHNFVKKKTPNPHFQEGPFIYVLTFHKFLSLFSMVSPSIAKFPILTLTLLFNTRFFFWFTWQVTHHHKITINFVSICKISFAWPSYTPQATKSLQMMLRMNVKKKLCIKTQKIGTISNPKFPSIITILFYLILSYKTYF